PVEQVAEQADGVGARADPGEHHDVDGLPDAPGVPVVHVADRADARDEAIDHHGRRDAEERQEDQHRAVEQLPADGARVRVDVVVGVRGHGLSSSPSAWSFPWLRRMTSAAAAYSATGVRPWRYGACETLSENCALDRSGSAGSPSASKRTPAAARYS